MGVLTLITLVAGAIVSWLFADWKAKRFADDHPGNKPFTWGFFLAYSGLIAVPLIILVYGIAAANDDMRSTIDLTRSQAEERFALSLIFGVPQIVLSLFMLKRSRWAFVISTVLSINAFLWIVNFIYFKNRWAELKAESQEPTNVSWWWKQPKGVRAFFFASIIWAIAWTLIANVFNVYGSYWYDEEYLKFFLILLGLPGLLGTAIFGYIKFVAPERHSSDENAPRISGQN